MGDVPRGSTTVEAHGAGTLMAFAEHERPEFSLVEQTAEQKARAEQRRRTAALAAGGALAVGAAARGDDDDAVIPGAAARAKAAGVILAAIVSFFAAQRDRTRVWLKQTARTRQPGVSEADIDRLIVLEAQRGEEFERRSIERFARDLTGALAIPDAGQREGAIRGLVTREGRYARQREEAMAARMFAAVDRVVIRQQSPSGAFWKLGVVNEHSAGCLVMAAGKFWPWAVLDRVHPPRHVGCACKLLSYGEAVAAGLMGPGDVQDVRKAVMTAAAIVMEGALVLDDPAAAMELIEEAYGSAEVAALRQASVAAGLTTAEKFDAAVYEGATT